jgi:protease-4
MEIKRESVALSALRSFCRAFFAVSGILLAFFIFSTVYSLFSSSPLLESKTTLNILPDAAGKRELVSLAAPAILQINVHGPIAIDPKDINNERVENILIESRTGLLANNRVKGILLHINSPGGSALDSDDIYLMLKEYKQRYNVPIFAYVDGLCASGGMYIASAADQIFASPSSMIGSVGVIFGPFFNIYNTMTKIGLEAKTLTEGLDKDTLNPTRPWRSGEEGWLQDLIAFSYDRFVSIVTEARPRLSKDQLVNVLGAKMFNCQEAEQLGYIDHAMTNRSQALLALMEQAHIDPSQGYQVVELEPKQSWLAELVRGRSQIEHKFDFGTATHRSSPVSYLYQPN